MKKNLLLISLMTFGLMNAQDITTAGTQSKPVEINVTVKGDPAKWEAATNDKLSLFEAAQKGDVLQVMNLLNKGAKANVIDFDSGTSPLMLAAEAGFPDIVQLLITKGADVNKKTFSSGATALMFAARNGHTKVVEILLKNKADKNARTFNGGLTAAQIAKNANHTDIVNLLNKK
jgi:ankyrin repeat protein